MIRLFKWISGFLVALLIIFGGALYALTRDDVQEMLYQSSLRMLAETLQTKVTAKNIAVDFKHGGVALYGVSINDKRDTAMLQIDTLQAGIALLPLLQKDVNIRFLNLYGVRAKLYRDQPKSPLNIQFLIDALKKKSPKKQHEMKKKGKLNLNVSLTHLDIHSTDFHYDVLSMSRLPKGKLDPAHIAVKDFSVYVKGNLLEEKTITTELKHLKCKELNSGITLDIDGTTYRTIMNRNVIASMNDMKIAYGGTKLNLGRMTMQQQRGNFDFSHPAFFNIKGLHVITDNGKPRKNFNRPKRGFFDPGHFDAYIDMDATMHYAFRDSMHLRVNKMAATDKGSGLIIENLVCDIRKTKERINIMGLKINLPKTVLQINTASVILQKKTDTTPAGFTLNPCMVKAKTCLQDIAKPFAPILSNFTTPLNLRTTVYGNLDKIVFDDIRVFTDDSKLRITAVGDLCDVAKKKLLTLHFYNIKMSAQSGIKEQIVGHFRKKVNLKMEEQMRKLGDVQFSGRVGVFYKYVTIGGSIYTNFGDINFGFGIDGNKKMLTGNMNTKDFELGNVMDIKGLGPVTMNVDYGINTSKKKVSKHGGKLPIGWLKANILNSKFKILSFKNITAEGKSDGRTATGTLLSRQGAIDVIVDFSYSQTADGISYYYKPRLKKHIKTEAEETTKDKEKEAKREAKLKAKEAKRQEKEAKRMEKEAKRKEKEANEASDTTKSKKLRLFDKLLKFSRNK